MIEDIIDWSEIWALLIPVAVAIILKPKPEELRPLLVYIFIGLILNSISTIAFVYHASMPGWLKNNNVFYNIHSIARVVFFGWYVYRLASVNSRKFYRILFYAYALFVIINCVFIKSIFFFSTWLFAAESIILLTICLSFYLKLMQDESAVQWTHEPFFLVCTGIILYEAITFFIFLFIIPLADSDPTFGLLCLKIYKITFVILCCLIAIAIYKTTKKPKESLKKLTAT